MARYDYKCSSCGNVFEVEHPMSETPEVVCPSCGAPASKTFSASGIKFEGSGFYNTDQRSFFTFLESTFSPASLLAFRSRYAFALNGTMYSVPRTETPPTVRIP